MAEPEQEPAESPEEVAANSEFKLTDREIIIAKGGDPDEASSGEEESLDEAADSEPEASEPETSETETSEPESWVTDKIRDRAKPYNLSDQDLEDFGSEDNFEKTARALDRQAAYFAGKEAKAKPGEESKDDDESAESDEKELDPFEKQQERIKKLKDEGYEEEVIDVLDKATELAASENKRNKELQDQLSLIQERYDLEEQDRQAKNFHDVMDTMDEELFGRTYVDGEYRDLPKEQDENRRKVWLGVDETANGIQATAERDGVSPEFPDNKTLIQQAADMKFGAQLRSQEQGRISRQVKQQSKRRRPVGSPAKKEAPVPVAQGPIDQSAETIANDPRVVEFWEKAQQ